MKITNTQLAKYAFIPGYAERIEAKAENAGLPVWSSLARNIKYSRNILYTGIVLTVIGVAGALFSGSLAFKAGAVIGLGLAAFGGKNLHVATNLIKEGLTRVHESGPFFNDILR